MASGQVTNSVLQLSTASLQQLEQQIASGQLDTTLRDVFGEGGANELEQMATAGSEAVLGGEPRPQVILLPGVTGSTP